MANTRNTKTAPKNNSAEVDALKQQLQESSKQIEELKNMVMQLTKQPQDGVQPVNKQMFVAANSPDRWVTIVHLTDYIEGLYTVFKNSAGVEYRFSSFGQTRRIKLTEFEDILSLNRKLFDRMLLTVGHEDNDLVETYSLPKADRVTLNNSQLSGLVDMSEDDLQKLYNKVCDTHKALICKKWQIGYFEKDEKGHYPKNISYNNLSKITLLNELSGGALNRVLRDVSERRKTRN